MRYQQDVTILAHRQIADSEYEITLRSPEIANAAKPGQFVQLRIDETYKPYTRRPFSIYRVDPERGEFGIIYLARGVFTYRLAAMPIGETISVVGPLGNSFEPNTTPDTAHVLVAGGVGAPPLYFLTTHMLSMGIPADNIVVINGARTRELLVADAEYRDLGVEVIATTEDGSYGCKGRVLGPLADKLQAFGARAQVYSCGPTPMLQAVAGMCADQKVGCKVSVETLMPCGLGVCMGCVVKIKDASDPNGWVHKRACHDGPVFDADEIIWD